MSRVLPMIAAATVLVVSQAFAPGQDSKDIAKQDRAKEQKPDTKTKPGDDEPVVTKHELTVNGKTLKYTASAGMTPISDREGNVEAHIFSISYTLDDPAPKSKRPLMFSFNGGPGSASVWLHLGALGPKRIALPDDATFAKPPFQLTDNASTWLEFTDLVFIDPVGTGFSRAVKPELNKKFHSVRGDIESVADFIRLYLTRNERWGSPLFVVGESYGTTRAAGLSDSLVDQGVALNGVVLVSTVLNFQTLRFGTGNDLPFVLYVPTYTASAWYHRKLSEELQKRPLRELLDEVERWAAGDYARALERGDRLSDDERSAVIKRLAGYTGLGAEYVDNSNMRIEIMHFCKELLRDRKLTVGRLDSRYTGVDDSNVGERITNDPSMSAIRPPYTATFAAYVRGELGYKTDRPYYILGEGVGNWDFNVPGGGYADTSAALRDAIAKNPNMKIFVASGFYDLATPYFATQYTLSHMELAPSQRKQFSQGDYEAGHMMYVHSPSLEKLKADVAKFVESAL